MLRSVADHVAAMAEGCAVGVRVVGRVVIPVGGCRDDTGSPVAAEDTSARPDPDSTAPVIAPAAGSSIPPTPSAEVVDYLPVRSPAALTAALRPTKANCHRQLAPVERVE